MACGSRPAAPLPAVALVFSLLLGACTEGSRQTEPGRAGVAGRDREQEVFTDRASELGLDFVHFNGMAGEYYFPEIMGAGGALFDYDGDGDLDLYLVQGQMLGADKEIGDALIAPRYPLPLTDRLYRNDLEVRPDGTRTLRLVDVTERSRIDSTGYGMGVTTGDYDGDGWPDLYVTNFGSNRMLRNTGHGTFQEVTRETGTDDPRWSVSALFFDYDGDGRLDLYVGNYLDFTMGTHKECVDTAGARDWCGPSSYNGEPDRLFRNRGDGTFRDASPESGVGAPSGRGLGAVAADLDGDGRIDLYVANDGEPNFLWLNQGDGAFRDEALLAGCAVNADGRPEASMGVDAGDYDNDGDADLVMTHLTNETHALFRNRGDGVFTDVTVEAGLAHPSWEYTGFGAAWFDYDNDGWLDLLAVCGAVHTIQSLAQAGDLYPLHQRRQLFRGSADGRFEETTTLGGEIFEQSEVGRGAAFGDLDNDGDTDVLVVNNSGPARLLMNKLGSSRRWLGVSPASRRGSALGTRLVVRPPAGRELHRQLRAGGSYASASDPRVLVGLGDSAGPIDLQLSWPDGGAERWSGLPPGRYLHLPQGGRSPAHRP
jgi:hypothetical protein